VAKIDTTKCPLFLLTGEYDYSCTPEDALAIAKSAKGTEATIMKGMGHFPMSEDPKSFLEYLLPILSRIKADEHRSAA
jgi:pimeloyl-ACP methyl ester carboxylesterase